MPAPWLEAGVWLLVGLVAVLVLFVVFLVWRDGYLRGWRAARNMPPTCPKCGYNLSGLRHCRCPECGTEYELDVLWKSYLLTKQAVRQQKHGSANLPPKKHPTP